MEKWKLNCSLGYMICQTKYRMDECAHRRKGSLLAYNGRGGGVKSDFPTASVHRFDLWCVCVCVCVCVVCVCVCVCCRRLKPRIHEFHNVNCGPHILIYPCAINIKSCGTQMWRRGRRRLWTTDRISGNILSIGIKWAVVAEIDWGTRIVWFDDNTTDSNNQSSSSFNTTKKTVPECLQENLMSSCQNRGQSAI